MISRSESPSAFSFSFLTLAGWEVRKYLPNWSNFSQLEQDLKIIKIFSFSWELRLVTVLLFLLSSFLHINISSGCQDHLQYFVIWKLSHQFTQSLHFMVCWALEINPLETLLFISGFIWRLFLFLYLRQNCVDTELECGGEHYKQVSSLWGAGLTNVSINQRWRMGPGEYQSRTRMFIIRSTTCQLSSRGGIYYFTLILEILPAECLLDIWLLVRQYLQ